MVGRALVSRRRRARGTGGRAQHISGTQKKNGLLGIFGPKNIIARLNAARCQLSDSLSTKVKLQEAAKLHSYMHLKLTSLHAGIYLFLDGSMFK